MGVFFILSWVVGCLLLCFSVIGCRSSGFLQVVVLLLSTANHPLAGGNFHFTYLPLDSPKQVEFYVNLTEVCGETVAQVVLKALTKVVMVKLRAIDTITSV